VIVAHPPAAERPPLSAPTPAATDAREAPTLEARGVVIEAGGRRLLHGVDVALGAGELVGLVGPNGAGKSTLLRALTGMTPLAAGSVTLGGRPLAAIDRRERARHVAVVQQLPEAPRSMAVAELVLLGRYPHLGLLGRETARDRDYAAEAMRRAGCLAQAGRELGTLSGGERRRAFIARALAQEATLLLLDEPTAHLDVAAQAELFAVLRELAAGGAGVLIVAHDLTLAAVHCERLLLLAGGRVVAQGEPEAVVSAENVARVYGAGVDVIDDPRGGGPLVVPAR
jgi:iron complex transport system ATP-binding protein